VVLHNVHYRKNDPLVQQVVIRWKPNGPPKRDEPWFLMSEGR